MYRNSQEYLLFDNVTPVAITSSTSATPIVVTATSHGFTNGQKVLIQGHATNTNANGIFTVAAATTNTFALTDQYTGANIAGNGTGSNTGFCVLAPAIMLVSDFRNAVFSVFTTGSASMTFQLAGSIGKPGDSNINNSNNLPNMGATVSAQNPYSFIQLINLATAATINGGTGIVLSGTDTQTMYEANFNLLKYLTLLPTAWTQGAFTVKAIVTSNL